jgi:N-acetylglucosaminyl-diphospho-decaprenol L-rhamnosyltransferase
MSVAIVNYNTRDHLQRCLASVLREQPAQVIVTDNGSSDGSAEMVRRDFPGVIVHVDPANPGFGAGANAALRRCATEHVLLLNSDTLVQPGALDALATYLDATPRAAVVGPRLVSPDGRLQRSCFAFPTPGRPLFRHRPLRHLVRRLPIVRDRYLGTWPHTHARIVPWVLGAALAIRLPPFWTVGGFDDSFFMYFEEVDLCYRLRAIGWETHFAPVTDVVHAGGASTAQYRADMLAHTGLSSIRFYQRHYSGVRLAQGVGLIKLAALGRLARDAARYYLTRRPSVREGIRGNMQAWRRVLRAPGEARPPEAETDHPSPTSREAG